MKKWRRRRGGDDDDEHHHHGPNPNRGGGRGVVWRGNVHVGGGDTSMIK